MGGSQKIRSEMEESQMGRRILKQNEEESSIA